MSSIEAVTDSKSVETGGQGPYFSVLGYGSIGIAIAGTFTSGSFKFQGTNDGNTWTDLQVFNGSTAVDDNLILTTGNYVCGIVSYQTVRLFATTFVGKVVITSSVSPQIIITGDASGDIVVDSVTIDGLGEGIVYNIGDDTPLTVIPNGNVGQILTSRGPGLAPEMMNAADISAFTTGSPLVSNPVQVNPLADFGRVTNVTGVGTYVASAGAGTTNMRGVDYGAGLWVAVGDSGTILTSPSGLTGTWTARNSDTLNRLDKVRWNGSYFLAVGASGTVTRSTDGITWVAYNIIPTTTDPLYCLAWSGTRWVVGGLGGKTWWSTTGLGSSWTLVATGASGGSGIVSMIYSTSHSLFILGYDHTATHGLYTSTDGTAWTIRLSVAGTGGFYSLAQNGVNLITVGLAGEIYSSVNATAWTSRTSGTAENLRTSMYANGYFYAAGGAGVNRVSTDNGVTWGAGPSTGVSTILRGSGVNTTSAVVVGDTGTMLSNAFQFLASVYPTNADRLAGTNVLGTASYAYSDTPIPVVIPGQITFNIAVVVPADMPFNFDVVTIADMVYNLFVVQNSSLSPGPYYGFNAVYDFGVDNRWEFGAQSVAQYATLLIQDSTTGIFYIKKSSTTGNAGQPITWVDSFQLLASGALRLASLAGTGSRTVVADATGLLSAP